MKHNVILFFLAIILFPPVNFASGDAETQTKPNLLFIFPDQFRVQSMGFMNEDPVITPNIDRLATQGMVFTNAVSNRPLCSPYRAMLMTGKYPFSNGVQTNVNTSSRKFGNFLKDDEICFGDVLKANGYYAGYIGKWHLDAPGGPDVERWQDAVWGTYTPPGPKRHGFDFWHAYGCHNRHDDPYYWETNASIEDTLFPREWSPIHEAKVASEFIESNKGKPWALFVSMNPPHGPYNEVPERYRDIYKNTPIDSLLNRPNVPDGKPGDIGRRNVTDYFACVSGVDEQIGKILNKLEETGQAENTIVVFTADHGEMMGSHGLLQKVVYYEESLRVPFIARWPGKIKPEENSLHLSVPDIMPTVLGLMGVKEGIPTDIEGDDYSKTFRGIQEETPEFTLYINSSFPSALGGMRGLRNDRYTFVIQRNNSGEIINTILFDNKNDPFQLNNIARQHPNLTDKFKSQIFQKLAEINDPWIEYAVP
jgi:arylsulfatase A-like enzyme